MSGINICPSAGALMKSIREAKPEMAKDLLALAQAHFSFVQMTRQIGMGGRDSALAITKSEEAFAWALKGIADTVLYREGGAPGGGGVMPPCDTET